MLSQQTAKTDFAVHVHRCHGESQSHIGPVKLRAVEEIKRVTGDRPLALQRLVVAELQQLPFHRIDLAEAGPLPP